MTEHRLMMAKMRGRSDAPRCPVLGIGVLPDVFALNQLAWELRESAPRQPCASRSTRISESRRCDV